MKRVITLLVSFVLIGVYSTSCTANSSQVKWGYLTDVEDVILLKVPPKGKVTVCSDNQQIGENVVRSVLTWAKEIGRGNYLNVDNSCNNDTNFKINVKYATTVEGYPNPTACTDGQGQIYYSDAQQYGQFPVMLHEIGHNWGLCDQYENGDPAADNCSNELAGHTNADKTGTGNSVMGGNYGDTLTSDDIEGIKYIAEMQNIGVNKEWKEFLSNPDNNDDSDPLEPLGKPPVFIKPNGEFIDIYISHSKPVNYCIGSKEVCKSSKNQKTMSSETIDKAGTVYKVSYVTPKRITADSPFNVYQDGKLIRTFYLK